VILCDSNDVDGDSFGKGVVVLTITTKSMPDGRYHRIL
jgi:hypothetical protein